MTNASPVITSVVGRSIVNSQREMALEVTLTSAAGNIATASLPAGTSLGQYEEQNLNIDAAVSMIQSTLAPQLMRQSFGDQPSFDAFIGSLAKQDASYEQQYISMAVSVAFCRLLAQEKQTPTYRLLADTYNNGEVSLPIPVFNVLNGGKHAANNLDFQDYMIIVLSPASFYQKLSTGRAIFQTLGQLLQEAGYEQITGFEGGYAPNMTTNEEGLGFLVRAIEKSGRIPGSDVVLALDVAASSLPSSYVATVENYRALLEDFPLYWLEDPFKEDQEENWESLYSTVREVSDKTYQRLLVGDDLLSGKHERFTSVLKKNICNAASLKINQFSSVTALSKAIATVKENGVLPILSHRSRETLDSFLSDAAVGFSIPFIKAGSSNDQAAERMVKYERLTQIEEEINLAKGREA